MQNEDEISHSLAHESNEAFIARSLESMRSAITSGHYYTADEVHAELAKRLGLSD